VAPPRTRAGGRASFSSSDRFCARARLVARPQVSLNSAHDQAIWDMSWHPVGHVLATGSNDNRTKVRRQVAGCAGAGRGRRRTVVRRWFGGGSAVVRRWFAGGSADV
jgi:hypothetical protein